MRFKLTDEFGNDDYLYLDRVGDWHLVTKDLTPLSLSHISKNAALLKFALEDAKTPTELLDAVRKNVRSKWSIKPLPRKQSVEQTPN